MSLSTIGHLMIGLPVLAVFLLVVVVTFIVDPVMASFVWGFMVWICVACYLISKKKD